MEEYQKPEIRSEKIEIGAYGNDYSNGPPVLPFPGDAVGIVCDA
jgi:hypothetical protein